MPAPESRSNEVRAKLESLRESMARHDLAAVRFRGVDWFSWITAGGSSVVILTSEVGIAEVLVTRTGAWVLTNVIERERLLTEELPPRVFSIEACSWQSTASRESFVRSQAQGGMIASDRPQGDERPLPSDIVAAKRRFLPSEVLRYRALGRDAAEAMSDALGAAEPAWSEEEFAAAGSGALWARGIHSTLILAAGHERALKVRHPWPTRAPLGRRAMLVFCARREGLYANLTRWVYFEAPSAEEIAARDRLARIEARALSASRGGARLGQVYSDIASAYADQGVAAEIDRHHQGGTTGYLSREVVAVPDSEEVIQASSAVAWNPSVPGAKLEDTVFVTASNEIEVLTRDPDWPSFEHAGRMRPDFLVRA